MSCEADLTSADLDDAGVSQHTLGRLSDTGGSASLFQYIAFERSQGFNLHEPEALKAVIRPFDERDLVDPERSLCNLDEDDGVLIDLHFSELVRVKAIILSTPPSGDERVANCRIWANRDIGLDEVEDVKPDQDFELLEGERGAVEYPLRLNRFSNVSSLSIYLDGRRHPGQLRLFYLGFKGASRAYQKEPGTDLSVAAQNAADAPIDGVREKYGASQTTIR